MLLYKNNLFASNSSAPKPIKLNNSPNYYLFIPFSFFKYFILINIFIINSIKLFFLFKKLLNVGKISLKYHNYQIITSFNLFFIVEATFIL